jgi:hypothetical protein
MEWPKDIPHSIEEVNPGHRSAVSAVTDLHLKLIGRGEIARLGRPFLERVCYGMMLRDGLLKSFLFRVNGAPVGFITVTPHSVTLHRRAIRKHFFPFVFILLWSIISQPRGIGPLVKAIRLVMMRQREIDHRREPAGEILAVGVVPECRTPEFIHKSGLRIADDLFGRAVSYFRSIGLDNMDVFYYDFQLSTLLFYWNLGGKISPCEHDGRSLFHISFNFDRIEKSP